MRRDSSPSVVGSNFPDCLKFTRRKTTVTTLNYGHRDAVAQAGIIPGWPRYRNCNCRMIGSIAGIDRSSEAVTASVSARRRRIPVRRNFLTSAQAAFRLLWRPPLFKPARLQGFLRRRGIRECATCRRRRRMFCLQRLPAATRLTASGQPRYPRSPARWHIEMHLSHDDIA